MSDQTFDNDAIIKKIIKLLAVAKSTTFEEEAASAAAMAQNLMVQYNLDVGALEKKGGSEGAREKSAIDGAFYKYTRDLYAAVSKLNFCTHWITEEVRRKKSGTIWRKMGSPPEGRKHTVKIHNLIGRTVNIASTRVMCEYLEDAIERILGEHLLQNGYSNTYTPSSQYKMSFREGAVANVIGRIEDERRKAEEERQRKAQEEKVRNSHPSSAPSRSTALTLTDYTASEEAANYDIRYGEGAWARRLGRIAKWEEVYRMDEEGLECLKIFHPEAYKKLLADELAQQIKDAKKYRFRSGPKEKEKDWGAYNAGERAGSEISLNQQIDQEKRKALK